MKSFNIGTRVVSLPVGSLPAFKGVIVGAYQQYVVRDEHGQEWCRLASELQHVRGRKPREVTREGK